MLGVGAALSFLVQSSPSLKAQLVGIALFPERKGKRNRGGGCEGRGLPETTLRSTSQVAVLLLPDSQTVRPRCPPSA